ncbi:hypothetical protein BDW62DRAFT_217003 [Aspergillus aurantiobrunneus]
MHNASTHTSSTATSDSESTWGITIEYLPDFSEGVISSISLNNSTSPSSSSSPLALSALVHSHVLLDKAFIHNTPSYSYLLPSTGSFQEALTSTTEAKATFTHADLLKAADGFLPIPLLQRTCLEAGLALKEKWKDACEIQLVCFAQDPIFSTPHGEENRRLIETAIRGHTSGNLSVLGTTPYVESSIEASKQNIEWAVDMALQSDRHLDFHLDNNLSPPEEDPEPLVWHVLHTLRAWGWTSRATNKRIMLSHCTRLSLSREEDWSRLAREIYDNELPVSFVGLATSDLYMAATPFGNKREIGSNPRGTLLVPSLIRDYGLDAVIGVNNVGNAFTPWGSADPLSLACLGVGIYRAGTVGDSELLHECVSTRARAAIGLPSRTRPDSGVRLKCGDCADCLLLTDVDDTGFLEPGATRARKSVAEAVWDPPARTSRAVVCRGRVAKPAGLLFSL